ncbi:hypothetical protein J6590_096078 [Homalodisca vitripennis]|nr:hypothetical protein J6590_096078 [Homalodisca vitripennis]
MTLKSESVIVDNKDESLYNLWKVCGENSAPQYVPNCDQTTINVQNSPVHDESTMIYSNDSNENDLDVGLTDLDLLDIEEMPIGIDGNIIDLGMNTVVEDDNNIDLGLFTTFTSNEVDTLPNITAIKVQGNDQIGRNDKLEYVEQSDDSPNQHIEVTDVICKSKEDDKSKEDEYVSCTIELLTERPHEQSISSDDHTENKLNDISIIGKETRPNYGQAPSKVISPGRKTPISNAIWGHHLHWPKLETGEKSKKIQSKMPYAIASKKWQDEHNKKKQKGKRKY